MHSVVPTEQNPWSLMILDLQRTEVNKHFILSVSDLGYLFTVIQGWIIYSPQYIPKIEDKIFVNVSWTYIYFLDNMYSIYVE